MECNASLCIQVFEHDVDAHANDIEVHPKAYASFTINIFFSH